MCGGVWCRVHSVGVLVALSAVIASVGCGPVTVPLGGSCQQTTECQPGLACVQQRCQSQGTELQRADGREQKPIEPGREPAADASEPSVDGPGESLPDARPDAQPDARPTEPAPTEPGPTDGGPSLYQSCTNTASCDAGQVCMHNVCMLACDPYLDPHRCPTAAGHMCIEGVCWVRCDPDSGNGPKDCPSGLRCVGGFCVTPRVGQYCVENDRFRVTPHLATRPANGQAGSGERCLSFRTSPNGSPTLHCDASKGLFCLADLGSFGTCEKACDPEKGILQNADCGVDQDCEPDCQSPTNGRCIKKEPRKARGEVCAPKKIRCMPELTCAYDSQQKEYLCATSCEKTKGIVTNAACQKGTYCSNDRCRALPKAPTGTLQLGQPCTPGETSDRCDGSKGLFCGPGGRCAVACHPKDGESNNPACASGHSCYELPERELSSLGGMCFPQGTKQAGERCQGGLHQCAAGLSCYKGVCFQGCDPAKGILANPSCSADQACGLHGPPSVCVTLCQRAKGIADHPRCAVGTYCYKHNYTDLPTDGYCRPSRDFPQGPRQVDEVCDFSTTSELCDGSKGLFCIRGKRCRLACDPRKGRDANPACGAGQECRPDFVDLSPLQGTCTTPDQRAVGDLCLEGQCAAGLRCVLGRCAALCQVAQGVTTNPACPKGFYCTEEQVCKALPKANYGTKQEGDACVVGHPSRCDERAGLYCDPDARRCLRTCAMADGATNNAACLAGEECVEDIRSHTGGKCLKPPSAKEGADCDHSDRRCLAGLVCLSGTCFKACDRRKGQDGNPSCSASTSCVSVLNGMGSEYSSGCLLRCDPLKGTYGNKGCPVRTFCGRYIQGAFCLPTSNPPARGNAGAGGSCRFSDECKDTKALTCGDFRCRPTCNPRNGHADCPSGEVCKGTSSNIYGGYCDAP